LGLILRNPILHPMSKKLIVDGEVADYKYNLRTTQGIIDFLVDKAGQTGSVNVLINEILLKEKKKLKSSKTKKQ